MCRALIYLGIEYQEYFLNCKLRLSQPKSTLLLAKIKSEHVDII